MELSDQDIDFIIEALKFYNASHDGSELAESLMSKFGNEVVMEEAFDPYTDPDTKAMLERSGVATYKYRR